MKNLALYFFGVCLLIFSAAIFTVASAVSTGIHDAKYVIAQAPVVLEQVKSMKGDVDEMAQKVQTTVANLKASLPTAIPTAGTKIGEAGANALKSFSSRISGGDSKEQPATEAVNADVPAQK